MSRLDEALGIVEPAFLSLRCETRQNRADAKLFPARLR